MLKKCSQCVHAGSENDFGTRLCERAKEFCIDERLWDEATGACGRSAQFFQPRPSDIEAAPAMREGLLEDTIAPRASGGVG